MPASSAATEIKTYGLLSPCSSAAACPTSTRVEPAGLLRRGVGLQRLFGFALQLGGTATFTVTNRSPCPPPRLGTPRPRTRRMRPSAVPSGTRTLTVPSRVGTVSVVPSASSVKLTGMVTVRSVPSRPNTESGRTCTVTYRSPDGAPRRPASPWPASRIRWPSSTPAGMRTLMVRVRVATPVPLHSSQGFSMIDPLPRQSVHGSEKPNAPWLRLIAPNRYVGQTFGLVPGRARCHGSWCTAPGW